MNDDRYLPYLRALSEAEIAQSRAQQEGFLAQQRLALQIRYLQEENQQIAVLKGELFQLQAAVADQAVVIQDREATLGQLQGSLTWRMTAPLRWLGRRLCSVESARAVSHVPLAEPGSASSEAGPAPAPAPPPAPEGGSTYAAWVQRYDSHTQQDWDTLRQKVSGGPPTPTVSLLSSTSDGPARLDVREAALAQLQSLQDQLVQTWTWCVVYDQADAQLGAWLDGLRVQEPRLHPLPFKNLQDACGPLNHALGQAEGEWVMFLPFGGHLAPHALYCLLGLDGTKAPVRLVYADEDDVDGSGSRSAPSFKPEFNHELLLAHDYLGHPVLFRQDLLGEVGGLDPSAGAAARHDLWLRFAETLDAREIGHVPRVLFHRTVSPEDGPARSVDPVAAQKHAQVVRQHLLRRGIEAAVGPNEDAPGCLSVRLLPPRAPPKVSIVIPTRDKVGLLFMCLRSLLEQTRYPDFEIVLVDNGSERDETALFYSQLSDPRIQLVRDDRPFNFSRLINAGVRRSDGAVLCLLNNDIEVISAGWLEDMVAWCLLPDVGAVGARLWYGDGRLQHAGISLGLLGVAGHTHKGLRRGDSGYLGRASLIQSVSAVTGACMVVRREVFDQLGGFDEALTVAYNDVDFCLRASAAGYHNVYTPHAELTHHESISRGLEDSPAKKLRLAEEAALMRARWASELDNDPAYNPNLTLEHEDCSLAWPPRVASLSDT